LRRILAVALVAVAVGCAESSDAEDRTTTLDWSKISMSGDELYLPDGTVVELSVRGRMPPPCTGRLFPDLAGCVHECEDQEFEIRMDSETGTIGPGRLYLWLEVEPTRCESGGR
jgi:hypothetical protein